jgi:hypothetical protein
MPRDTSVIFMSGFCRPVFLSEGSLANDPTSMMAQRSGRTLKAPLLELDDGLTIIAATSSIL